MRDGLSRLVKHRKERRAESRNRYSEQSRERLKKSIETKIRTTMIGALALIEEKFGFLWGQDKSEDELTDHELDMEDLKEELRTEILNQGNAQLRAAQAEIDQYDVRWNRYQYNVSGKEHPSLLRRNKS